MRRSAPAQGERLGTLPGRLAVCATTVDMLPAQGANWSTEAYWNPGHAQQVCRSLVRARTVSTKVRVSRLPGIGVAQRRHALMPGMLQTLSAARSADAAVLAAVLGGGCGVNAQVWWRAMARARSGLGVQC